MIAAYRGITDALNRAFQDALGYRKGKAMNDKKLAQDKEVLTSYLNKYPQIRYLQVAKNPPKNGRYKGKTNYFRVYSAMRQPNGARGKCLTLFLVSVPPES